MSGLRELGLDFIEEGNFERALAIFAESVRRAPADHRSRMLAARCFSKLGEKERAVTVLHACAEGLLRRDYLLSAIAACRQAMLLAPREKRIQETLARIHARASKASKGRAKVPPPLPPETIYDGKVDGDLMTLSGSDLSDQAISVLAAPDTAQQTETAARPPLPLFADLELGAFIDLVELMEYREVKSGTTLAQEGVGGDRIVMLVAGKAQVFRHVNGAENVIAHLSGGSIFGELSLMTGTTPSSTIRAADDVDTLEINRASLNELSKRFPSVLPTLTQFVQQRIAKNIIAISPLLAQIPEAERAALFSQFAFRGLQAGERAIVEGQQVSGLFMVLAGELIVQKEDPNGGVISLGVLREGDIAGEIALLKGLRATATVASTRKTATAFLDRASFEKLIAKYPTIRDYLESLSERRLKLIGEAMRPVEVLDADELVVE